MERSFWRGICGLSDNPSTFQAYRRAELTGHKVKEALSVSEVLYICEQEPVDAVVIAAEVDEPDVV